MNLLLVRTSVAVFKLLCLPRKRSIDHEIENVQKI